MAFLFRVLLAVILPAVAPTGGSAPARAATLSVTISAHRGGAGQWPQNSLLAFSHALAAGYGEIEADAWTTADGRHVIYHDATISKSRCGGPYAGRNIWTLTLRQIATVRCSGQPIPTEAQLLSLLRSSPDTRALLRLETKSFPGQSPRSAARWAYGVGEQVVDAGLAGRAIMQDFNWNGIPGYHAASKSLRVSALITAPTMQSIDRAARLGSYDLSYNAAYGSAAVNSAIAAHGLVPTVWGLDPVPESPGAPSPSVAGAAERAFVRAACAGAKVVITNYPALLTAYRPKATCPS